MKSVILAFAALFISISNILAESAPADAARITKKMLEAVVAKDYDAFVAEGNDEWKQIGKAKFERDSVPYGKRLILRHDTTYLGELRMDGCLVTLWRLRFKPGEDDLLVRLYLRGGRVTGFIMGFRV